MNDKPKDEKESNQELLFDTKQYDVQNKDWKNMPEFVQEDLTSWKQVIVHFDNFEDLKKFGELIGCKLTIDTRSIWFPAKEIEHYIKNKRYADEN